MNYKTRNLKKAVLLSVATFTVGIALGIGVTSAVAAEPEQVPIHIMMLQGCYEQGGFVMTRKDNQTGKKIYVTFQCRPAYESEQNPLGNQVVEPKKPNYPPSKSDVRF